MLPRLRAFLLLLLLLDLLGRRREQGPAASTWLRPLPGLTSGPAGSRPAPAPPAPRQPGGVWGRGGAAGVPDAGVGELPSPGPGWGGPAGTDGAVAAGHLQAPPADAAAARAGGGERHRHGLAPHNSARRRQGRRRCGSRTRQRLCPPPPGPAAPAWGQGLPPPHRKIRALLYLVLFPPFFSSEPPRGCWWRAAGGPQAAGSLLGDPPGGDLDSPPVRQGRSCPPGLHCSAGAPCPPQAPLNLLSPLLLLLLALPRSPSCSSFTPPNLRGGGEGRPVPAARSKPPPAPFSKSCCNIKRSLTNPSPPQPSTHRLSAVRQRPAQRGRGPTGLADLRFCPRAPRGPTPHAALGSQTRTASRGSASRDLRPRGCAARSWRWRVRARRGEEAPARKMAGAAARGLSGSLWVSARVLVLDGKGPHA